MILTPMLFSLALLGGPNPKTVAPVASAAPAKACIAADRTGTFRVVTKKTGGTALGLGLIVLENIDGCLEASFVTDDAGPAIIDGVAINGNTLTGNLKLSSGTAKVSLQFVGTNIAGSIVQGRNEWSIEGHKTS